MSRKIKGRDGMGWGGGEMVVAVRLEILSLSRSLSLSS